MMVTCTVSTMGSAAGASAQLRSCPAGATSSLGSAGASAQLRSCPAVSLSASCNRQVDTNNKYQCSACMLINKEARRYGHLTVSVTLPAHWG